MRKILVVDDSRLIQQIYKALLSSFDDCYTLFAASGDDALDLLERSSGVDLILLDRKMPGMDGYKFMEILRKDRYYKETPVIIVTSEESDEERQKAFKLGALDFISKSKPDKLKDSIKRVLDKGR